MAKILDPVTWKPGDIFSTPDAKWRDAKGGIVLALGHKAVTSGPSQTPQTAVARRKVIPCNRRFDLQQNWRWRQSSLIRLWRALPSGSVNSWNWFAVANAVTDRYGNTIHLSGFDWFCKLNGRLIHAILSTLTDPPPDATPGFTPTLIFDQIVASGSIFLGSTPLPSVGQSIAVSTRINRPFSSATSIYPYLFRVSYGFGDPDPLSVVPAAELIFNTTRTFLRAYPIDEYGRSPGETLQMIDPVS